MICVIRTTSDILRLLAPHLNLFQLTLLLKYTCHMENLSLLAIHNFKPFRASSLSWSDVLANHL